jgi:putative hydrolase of the HAD superfamily
MPNAIEAVLFDAGMTLVRTRPGVGKVYATVAARYGVRVDPEELAKIFRALWEARRNALHLASSEELERKWWRDLVADVFGQTAKMDDFGGKFDAFFQELYEVFAMPESWAVFDDAPATMALLDERTVRRAVVSNWDSRLPLLLGRLGLTPWFEFILTSAQAGFRKPDPRIFRIALDRLALAPAQVLFVGDLVEDDYYGAEKSGMVPILIDRNATGPDVQNKITRLTDIANWL